jgi:phage-related protein
MRKINFYRLKSGKCPVEEYLQGLPNNQLEKIFFVLDLIEQVDCVPRKYFKKLTGTASLWEVRVHHGNNIFRLLGFLGKGNLIILAHGFTKKTRKIPPKEIETATKRMKDYFSRRRKQ